MRIKSKLLVLSAAMLFSFQFAIGQSQVFRFAKTATGSSISINKIKVDSIGNSYIMGSFTSTFTYDGVTVNGSADSEGDLFILKTSPIGNVLYLHAAFSTAGQGSYVGLDKFKVNDRGELIAVLNVGRIKSLTLARKEIALDDSYDKKLLVKFSKTGFLVWYKVLRANGTTPNLNISDIELDESGNSYLTGSFVGGSANFGTGSITGTEGEETLFLTKFLRNGEVGYVSGAVAVGEPSLGSGIEGQKIAVGSNGIVYVSGIIKGTRPYTFNTDQVQNSGSKNAFLASFNAKGTPQWALPLEGSDIVEPGMISLGRNGNIAFVCYYKSSGLTVNSTTYDSPNDYSALVMNIKPDKSFNWVKNVPLKLTFLPTSTDPIKIRYARDNQVYTVGGSRVTDTNHIHAVCYSVTGALIWNKSTSGTTDIDMQSGTVDKFGNIMFSGNTYGQFKFLNEQVNSSGYGTSYIVRLLRSGALDYVYTFESSMDTWVNFNHIGSDAYGNLLVAGDFSGTSIDLGGTPVNGSKGGGILLTKYGKVGSMEGTVNTMTNVPITKGQVFLIGYSLRQRAFRADSVEIQADGKFGFYNIPLGWYILVVKPDNSDGSKYLRTYYPSTGSWSQAKIIKINPLKQVYSNLKINVPERVPLVGKGGISGKLTTFEEGDLKGTMAKPKPKGRASLARSKPKAEYEIIAETETDENGDFVFTGVEDGDYTVLIDVPGLPTIDPHEVTVFNGQFISNVDYYIDEEEVVSVGDPTSTMTRAATPGNSDIQLYPNPSSGVISVNSIAGYPIQSLQVLSLDGKQLIMEHNVSPNIDVNSLDVGVYIVNVQSSEERRTFKLMIRK